MDLPRTLDECPAFAQALAVCSNSTTWFKTMAMIAGDDYRAAMRANDYKVATVRAEALKLIAAELEVRRHG